MVRHLLAFAFVVVNSSCLFAEELNWGTTPLSLSTEEIHRKAAEVEKPETGDVEYLFVETLVRIEADGRTTETLHTIYRVLTETGVEEFGSVQAQWSPWYQDRPTIEARVVNSADDEVRLIEREIVEGSVQHSDSVYSDCRQLQAPLPAVSPGSIVETVVVTKDTQCFFTAGMTESRLFNCLYPTKHIRLVVDVADSLPFRHSAHGSDVTLSEKHEEDRTTYTWDVANPQGFNDFEFSAPPDVQQGSLVVYSTGESWAAVVADYAKLIESKLSAPDLKSKVDKLLEGETDERAKAEKLLSFVQQQIRYTGLMFGDGSIVPTAPEETLRRRYGDCKDQSALLIALLRHAGLDANPVLIKSSLGRDALPNMPGMGQFNHMIVHVKGDTELWIDPVATSVPLGQLPITDQKRQCLIIREDTKSLQKSPGSRPIDNSLTRVREYNVVNGGGSTLTETTVYSGMLASEVRQVIGSTSEKEFRASLRERSMERLMSPEVTDIECKAIRDTKLPLELNLKCVGTDLIYSDSSSFEVLLLPSIILQGFPEELLDRRPCMSDEELTEVRRDPFGPAAQKLLEEKQKPRIHRLPLTTPQLIKLTNRVHWPAGFEAVDIPKDIEYRIGGGYLTAVYRVESSGVFVAEYEANLGVHDLTPADVLRWQECVRELFGDEETPEWRVVVNAASSASRHFARGSIKLGLQNLRKQAAEHPENALYQTMLAEGYADAGFNAMARDLAVRNLNAFPDSHVALLSAAKVFDKPMAQGGFTASEDRRKAVEYCRKAVSLAPEDLKARFMLAALLQASPKGVLADRKTLRECASSFQMVGDGLSDTGHYFVLQSLFFAGDYEDVCRYHDKHSRDDSSAYYKLASIAILEDVDSAIALLNTETLGENRIDNAVMACMHLEFVREYEKAAEFLVEVMKWPEAKELSLRDRLDRLKALRHYETVLKPETDPIGVVQRLIINSLVGEEYCGSNANLLNRSTERFANISNELVAQWLGRKNTDSVYLASRIADVVSLGEFKQSGNASTGIKVTASMGFMTDVNFLLASVDGRLKVLTTTSTPEVLGEDAIEFLKKNQLVQARQCIVWASEELVSTATTQDPFVGSPLARFWTRSDSTNANALRVRCAAMMLAKPEKCPEALSIFMDMRRRVRPPEQIQIDRAVVAWATHHKKLKDALAAVDRLIHYPQGREAYWDNKVRMLTEDRQYNQALAWIEPQLKRNPSDPKPLMLKATVALEKGDPKEAQRLARLASESQNATYSEFNLAAWASLLAASVDQRAIEDAEKAVDLSRYSSTASLNTLASLCAENGKVQDAMAAVQQCMLLRGDNPHHPDDDFVYGRMAEQLGMSDVANFYYDRLLAASKSPEAGSPASLALQRRGRMKTVSHQSTTTK